MIKEYTGRTKKEALNKAKQELGRDIVILEERTVSRSGLFNSPLPMVKIKILKEISGKTTGLEKPIGFNTGKAYFSPKASPSRTLSKEIPLSSPDKLRRSSAPKIKLTGIGTYGRSSLDILEGAEEEENYDYKNKMEEFSKLAKASGIIGKSGLGDLNLEEIKQNCLNQDLHISVTEKVLHLLQAYKNLKKEDLEEKVKNYINEKIKTHFNIDFDTPRQKAVFFLGTAGVGKTTTLIKFAALIKNKIKKSIGIINLDTGKLAADEFLNRYADILEIPITTAHCLTDYRDAVSAYGDKDIILIDTMGLMPDAESVREYKSYIDIDVEIHKFLLLSADSNFSKLKKVLNKFGVFGPDNIIFTKLDEAYELVTLFNYIFNFDIPISFVTKGRDIPDDIDKVSSEKISKRFAETICGSFC